MESPDRRQLEKHLNGVVAPVVGWIGSAKRVGEEDVKDIGLVVNAERGTVEASSHFTTAARDE